MVTNPLHAQPPRWAEAILRTLLRPQDRDSVSGDLLEEYREAIVPALGAAADIWYVRQVGWFLLRASWLWGALVGASLVVRYLFDTLLPVNDYVMRSRVLSYTIIAVCVVTAFRMTLRTHSASAGVLTSVAAGAIGGLASIVGTAMMLAIWHDPATLQEWRNSGGLGEAFIVVPLIMIVIGAVMGTAGALLAKGISWPVRHLRHR
jgi:hypothetical protein